MSGCKHTGRALWAGLPCSRKHRIRSVDKWKTPVQSPDVADPAPGGATPVRNIRGDCKLALASFLAQLINPSLSKAKHGTISDVMNGAGKGIHCHSSSGLMGDFPMNQTQFCKASLTQNPRDKGSLPRGEADMDPNSLPGEDSSSLALLFIW